MHGFCAIVFLIASMANPKAEIEQFNRSFAQATRAMNNESVLALWADDGISLLPSTPPIAGKKAIAAFLADVMSQLPGAHMEKFDCQCHDIELSGSWASEWCEEHQIVRMVDKKKFDGWGKMLLVLHRDASGTWRIEREMWNQSLPPDTRGH